MVRTQIQLTEKQSRALKERAAQHGISVAEYVRRAVDKVLEQETTPDREELMRRSLAAIGRFKSDKTDVSVRHDDYLAEAYSQ
jgi:plasmid stability protein